VDRVRRITVVADSGNDTPESDEANNTGSRADQAGEPPETPAQTLFLCSRALYRHERPVYDVIPIEAHQDLIVATDFFTSDADHRDGLNPASARQRASYGIHAAMMPGCAPAGKLM